MAEAARVVVTRSARELVRQAALAESADDGGQTRALRAGPAPGCGRKKSNGRSSKPYHIVGMTGQSSARGR